MGQGGEDGLGSSPRQVPEACLDAPATKSTTQGTGPGEVVGKPCASAPKGWASVFPSVKGGLEPIGEHGLSKLEFRSVLAKPHDSSFRTQTVFNLPPSLQAWHC